MVDPRSVISTGGDGYDRVTKSHPSDPKIKTPLNQGALANLHDEQISRMIYVSALGPFAQPL